MCAQSLFMCRRTEWQHHRSASRPQQLQHNAPLILESSACQCSCSHGIQESGLPDMLAQICNNMASHGSICQGFVYNSLSGTAFFKGSPLYTPLSTSKLCLHPNSTVWLLNTGMSAFLLHGLHVAVQHLNGRCCKCWEALLDT